MARCNTDTIKWCFVFGSRRIYILGFPKNFKSHSGNRLTKTQFICSVVVVPMNSKYECYQYRRINTRNTFVSVSKQALRAFGDILNNGKVLRSKLQCGKHIFFVMTNKNTHGFSMRIPSKIRPQPQIPKVFTMLKDFLASFFLEKVKYLITLLWTHSLILNNSFDWTVKIYFIWIVRMVQLCFI